MSTGWWERYREAFAWEGGLLDIYVCGTDTSDWRKLLAALRTSPYGYELTSDGGRKPLPEDIDILFVSEHQHHAMLVVDEPHLALHCHFFTPAQIEFDLDPRAIAGEEQLGRLLDFCRWLGWTLGKAVLLAP